MNRFGFSDNLETTFEVVLVFNDIPARDFKGKGVFFGSRMDGNVVKKKQLML